MTTSQTRDTKAHFDRLSGNWSRNYNERSGVMYQRIDNFSVVLSSRLPPGARVLDFGCGSGDITRALAAAGFAMTGIDLSAAMIAVARQTQSARPIEWQSATPGAVILPFADGSFDGALASSVLEYHPDCAGQVREIHRVLKPGGMFAFSVPDMTHASRDAEKTWKALADSWLWPLLRLTPRRAYFEYLRISANRWPLDRWLAIAKEAGFEAESPQTAQGALAMIVARKPA